MALFKCKACGAPLEVRDGTEIAYRPYCEMKQTLPKDPVQFMSDGTSVNSLLKMAFMFLDDGEFEKANEYCDKVLDIEHDNARVYLGKLMAALRVRRCYACSVEDNNNYKNILRFCDEELISELKGYLAQSKLLEAAEINDTDTFNAMMREVIDINIKNYDGRAALMQAVDRGGNAENVNTLINAGADVNAKNKHGRTALTIAEVNGNTEVVKVLKRASSTRAASCMTFILQALTTAIIITILAVYL